MEAGDIDFDTWRGRELGEEPIYCAAPTESNDVICYGSDDEIDLKARVAKRLRYEEQGLRYLHGQIPFLLSASLQGPFDKASGWQNPWMQNGQSRRETRTNPAHQNVQDTESIGKVIIFSQLQGVPEKGNPTPATGGSMRCHLPSPDSIHDLHLGSGNHLDHEKRARIQEWASKVFQDNAQTPDGWVFERTSGQPDSGSKKRPADIAWLKSRLSKRRKPHSSQTTAMSTLTPTPCPQPKDIFWNQLKSAARNKAGPPDPASKPLSSSMRTTASYASGSQGHPNDLKQPFSRVTKLVDAGRWTSKCIGKANASQLKDENQRQRSPMPADAVHIDERSTLTLSHTESQNSSRSLPPNKGIVRSTSANGCLQDEAAISDQQADDENAVGVDGTADMSFESHLDNSFYYKSRPGKEDPPMVKNLAVAPVQVCSQITQTGTPESGRYGDAVVVDTALLAKPELLPNVENVTPTDSAISSPSPVDDSVQSPQDIGELPKKACNDQKPVETDLCTGSFIAERTSPAEVPEQLTSPGVEKNNEGQTSQGLAVATGDHNLPISRLPDDTVSPPTDVQHQAGPGQNGTPATTPPSPFAEISDIHPFIIPELALASPLNLLSSPAVQRTTELQGIVKMPAAVQIDLFTEPPVLDSIANVERSDSEEPAPERITKYPPPIIPEGNLSDQIITAERSLEQLAADVVCATVGDPMSLDEHHPADTSMVPKESDIVGCALPGNNTTAAVTKVDEAKNSPEKQAPVTTSATNDDEDNYYELATTYYHGAEDQAEMVLIQPESTPIEVTSSPIQSAKHFEDKLKAPIKIEPVESNEHTTAASQGSVLPEDVHDIEYDTRDIKAEPDEDGTWASCSGHISIPTSPVVQDTPSEVRPSQQSPWMEAIIPPALTIDQTPPKFGVNSSISGPTGNPRTSEEVQSPWFADSLHGSWPAQPCSTPTPLQQGALDNASQTEGLQTPDVARGTLVHHLFTPVVSQRAPTPELGFSIKSFANFNTPSPMRKPSGMRHPKLYSGNLPSALKHVGGASSDPWRNAQPRSSQPSSARRVTFAPLPGADVETVSLRHPSSSRPASPPPLALTSIEPGDEDEDGHFQKHFEVMRRRSGDTPKFRLAPRLLPNSSQQCSASPAASAMAEAFRDADAQENVGEESMITDVPHASSLGHRQGTEEVESTPQLPVHDTGRDRNMADAPQHSWQSEGQMEAEDDVADVLRNLDDFLNPRWEPNCEVEKAARVDTGKENQRTRFGDAEVDLWGTSVWDVPQDPEEGMEAFMTWN